MNFQQCAKCGLSLPITFLIPVIVSANGQQKKALICENCKKSIEQQKENKSA